MRSGFVLGFASFFLNDLEPEPLGALGPFLDLLALDFVARLAVMGLEDVVDIAPGESGVTGAKQFLGGNGFLLSLDQGKAAIREFEFGATGTELVLSAIVRKIVAESTGATNHGFEVENNYGMGRVGLSSARFRRP